MLRVPKSSPSFIVFALLMLSGGLGSSMLVTLSICTGLLSICLSWQADARDLRRVLMVTCSLVALGYGFTRVLERMSHEVSQDVSKCHVDCYIEFRVSLWKSHRARCQTIEAQGVRQGCRTELRLPSTHTWIPGARYRVAGGMALLESDLATDAWVHVRHTSQIGSAMRWAAQVMDYRLRVRSHLERDLLPASRGVVWALLSGRRDLLKPSSQDLLSVAGLVHFIAISGLHVGVLLGGWLWFGKVVVQTLPSSRRVRHGLTLLSTLSTIALILALLHWWGTPASALRSAGMWGFVMMARILNFRFRGTDALGASGLVLTLSEPALCRDLGFQLSALAVAGLLWAGRETQDGLWGIGTSLRSSLAATMATLPLTAQSFGVASVLGGSLSFVLTPMVVMCLVPLSLVACLGWVTESGVPALVIWGLEAGVGLFSWFAKHLASTSTHINWQAGYLTVCALVVLGLRWSKWGGTLCITALTYVFFGTLVVKATSTPRVDALNVGQGDATLVRTADHTVLFDTGGRPGAGWGEDGYYDAVRELRKLGVSRIDRLVLSHPDPDHTGGLEAILRNFEVSKLLLNYEPSNDRRLDRTITDWCGKRLACKLSLSFGETWIYGGTSFSLYPFGGAADVPLTDNEKSTAMLVSHGSHRLLMTGDLPRWSELVLLREVKRPISLLKLGHHGSRTSSDPTFLNALKPRIVWSSHGRANRFGHPHSEVLERVKHTGAQFITTADMGTLSFELGEEGWRLQSPEPMSHGVHK